MAESAHTPTEGFSHEGSYRGLSIAARLHRRRLDRIIAECRALGLGESGRLADFGCSNGFVLEQLRARYLTSTDWELFGFDHGRTFLNLAIAKNIPNASFSRFNLNVPSDEWKDAFDVVLCLETLEHTGVFRNALRNVANAVRPGGWLVVSIPVEIGLPGIVKYFGRRLLRRSEYTRFFQNKSELSYVASLLSGADMEAFRQPPENGWPEHLGFDNRRFDEFLHSELIERGTLELVNRDRISAGLGTIYRLRKLAS